MTATLYIEGGGDNRRLDAQFREGWTKFFEGAGLAGIWRYDRQGAPSRPLPASKSCLLHGHQPCTETFNGVAP